MTTNEILNTDHTDILLLIAAFGHFFPKKTFMYKLSAFLGAKPPVSKK